MSFSATKKIAKKAAPAALSFSAPWLGPVAGIAGNILGGVFGDRGQSAANQANLQIARENRAFQERMSSTAYQRSAKDLEKAGLNRILALGNSASTPSGNTAVMQNENQSRSAAAMTAATTAMTLRAQDAQIKNTKAQTANINADTILKGKATEKVGGEITNIEKMGRQIEQTILKQLAETKLTTAKGGREATISAMYDMIPDVIVSMQSFLGLSDETVDRLLQYFYRRQNNAR